MKHTPLGEVIAERELEFTPAHGAPQRVVVRFGKPAREIDGPWFCPYAIEGLLFQRQFHMAGEDSMQALLLAKKIIVVELKAVAREHHGSFTWLGNHDLGLT